MPSLPFTNRLGKRAGRTSGSTRCRRNSAENRRFLCRDRPELAGNARQAGFGVSHSKRAVAIHRAKIPLPSTAGSAGKRLSHADQTHRRQEHRRADDITQNVAGDAGALRWADSSAGPWSTCRRESAYGRASSRPEHREVPAHDHAHGVIEIRPLHLIFDVMGIRFFEPPSRQRYLTPSWRGRRSGGVLWICQVFAPKGRAFTASLYSLFYRRQSPD